jgi:hypothetical protein
MAWLHSTVFSSISLSTTQNRADGPAALTGFGKDIVVGNSDSNGQLQCMEVGEGRHCAESGRTSSSVIAPVPAKELQRPWPSCFARVGKTVGGGGDEGSCAKRHANNRAVTAAVHANGLALLCGVSRGRSLHYFGVELTGSKSDDHHKRP